MFFPPPILVSCSDAFYLQELIAVETLLPLTTQKSSSFESIAYERIYLRCFGQYFLFSYGYWSCLSDSRKHGISQRTWIVGCSKYPSDWENPEDWKKKKKKQISALSSRRARRIRGTTGLNSIPGRCNNYSWKPFLGKGKTTRWLGVVSMYLWRENGAWPTW